MGTCQLMQLGIRDNTSNNEKITSRFECMKVLFKRKEEINKNVCFLPAVGEKKCRETSDQMIL